MIKKDFKEKVSPFIDPFTEPPLYSVLVYGDNRSGKTHFCASAADIEDWKTLYIDADGGWITLKQFPNTAKEVGRMDLYSVKQVGMLDELDKIKGFLKKGEYDLIIFDTYSVFMNDAMIDLTDGKQRAHHHWNTLFTECLKFVKFLKAMNIRTIFTAFPKYITDAEGEVITIRPLLYGRDFPNYLLTPFNTICMLDVEIKKGKLGKPTSRTHVLSALQADQEVVGDRFGKLKRMENPTVKKVFDILEGRK